MISEFVREQKRYTRKDLCKLFRCPEEDIVSLIHKLKEAGVLKTVNSSDFQREMPNLMDENTEFADIEISGNKYLYVFTFVGIIVVAGCILKCYPKYLLNDEHPKNELQQVLKVLEKYNAKNQVVQTFSDSSEGGTFNLLAVLLFFIQDYYVNGVYSDIDNIVESNGSGEILWDKTINETFAILSNNKPYYINLQTKRRVTDQNNYFKRLHECILTEVSKELKEAELLDFFEITEVNLTDEELDDFGEKEYILYRIEKELNIQFNTRKQFLLKTIYSYIEHSENLYDTECLSLFGTNSFNLVWEKICAEIMDNQLNVRLSALQLPIPLKLGYDRNQRLIDLIERPLWSITRKRAKDTLVPDLISITENQFIIFDAKYYNAQLIPGIVPTGQPGIESVTKQYLYQLAYQKFIRDHEFSVVKNCFLIPTEDKEIKDYGEVSMKMLSSIGLQNIKVRFLPAYMAYEYYLSGKKMDINLLKL